MPVRKGDVETKIEAGDTPATAVPHSAKAPRIWFTALGRICKQKSTIYSGLRMYSVHPGKCL